MSIEAGPSSQFRGNGVENGIQSETSRETTALLPKQNTDEEIGETEEAWSSQSLGPGFIWIETGMFPSRSLR